MPVTGDAQESEAGSFALGETQMIPALRLEYVSVDNLYRKGVDPVSATGFIVSPELVWQADRRLLLLEASYKGEYASYSEDETNYDDHEFQLRAFGDLSSRHRLSSALNVSLGHEDQGTGQTRALTEVQSEQIEFSIVNARVAYDFGARNAKGNLRGGLVLGSVSYSNLEELTDGDDYSFIRPFAAFTYRLSPDTRMLAEVRFGTLDFDDDSRDRTEASFLTGVEMSATGKFGGDARIGILQASFDELSTADTTELIAEVGVYYELTSYSRLDLSFNRNLETVDDSDSVAGRSINDRGSLDWTHQWSSRFQSVSSLGLSNTDRECPSDDDRIVGVGVEFNYSIRRWLELGLGGRQNRRDVTECTDATDEQNVLDYDRTVFGVHVRGTL